MPQLSKYSKWDILAQATTAVSSGGSGEVNMAGYEGAQFAVTCNSTYAGTTTVTVQMAPSTTGTYQNVSGGTKASTGGTADIAVVDIYRPRQPELKAVVTTSTTVGTNWSLVALRYGAHKVPTTTTNITSVVSPGT